MLHKVTDKRQKNKNKKNSEPENASPKKKVKPFVGTSKMDTGNKQQEAGGNKAAEKTGKKKPRKSVFGTLKEKLSDDKDATLKSIEDKIKAIEGRGELTKTAKRKLKILNRLKRIAEGGSPDQVQQKKISGAKSELKNRGDKKKGTEAAKPQKNVGKKETNIQTKPKGGQGKQTNNAKAKSGAKVLKVEENSDDEESDNEEEEDELSDAEGEEEESDEAEGEEDSADEGEESDDEGEEEEDSDEEESEEDNPPQVVQNENAPTKKMKVQKSSENNKPNSTVNLEDLKKNKLINKSQKRYVLFVGNIPYDTGKQDLVGHFEKCGEIKHIRIPTEKKIY
ncbi:hypothetical protein NQ318_008586 [Aromia moschata]|uniref:RRM domain-containing protein n=1 Tax=Aromia moschata TaxID=1265417 RepID=A0AAV8YVV7_9CUCU|nr:hypothetical protein NQ318_008586 [Aromia moschata]